MTPNDLLDLPGPKKLATAIATRVEHGHSVVLVLPDHLVEGGIANAFLDRVASITNALFIEGGDPESTAVDQVVDAIGADGSWVPSMDPWRSLAEWRSFRGFRVLLRSWKHHFATVLPTWHSILMGTPHEPADRPVVIFAVRTSDVADIRLDRLGDVFLDVVWWWGVIDRLDTEVFLFSSLERPRHQLDTAVISEVTGWDLTLAHSLGTSWDGDVQTLARAVKNHGTTRPVQMEVDEQLLRGSFSRRNPPDRAISAWNAGVIDMWGGRPRLAAWLPQAAASLDKALWQAQSKVLLPYIEDERQRLERLFTSRASRDVLRDLAADRDGILELGPMRHAVRSRRVTLAPDERESLDLLTSVRNDLAHSRPVQPDALRQLIKKLGIS
ncbi:hypothetical protein [Georgenia muralis]